MLSLRVPSLTVSVPPEVGSALFGVNAALICPWFQGRSAKSMYVFVVRPETVPVNELAV
jgi:hypothetical protein